MIKQLVPKKMEVRRVQTDGGSHITPPLKQTWSSLRKLRWRAAVAALDSGLDIYVDRSKIRINGIPQFGYYDIYVGPISTGGYSYEEACNLLHGIELGARVAFSKSRSEGRAVGKGKPASRNATQ